MFGNKKHVKLGVMLRDYIMVKQGLNQNIKERAPFVVKQFIDIEETICHVGDVVFGLMKNICIFGR